MAIYEYLVNGETVEVKIDGGKDQLQVSIGGESLALEACQLKDNLISMLADGKLRRVFVVANLKRTYVHIGGKVVILDDAVQESERQRSGAGSGAAPGAITSPMPGNLIKVMVKEGDTVEEGQSLVIVEAMKMENEIRSPSQGVVKSVNFSVGDLVDAGVPIVELETDDQGDAE
jgi:biotin carboxyl carrier protein